MRQLRVLCQTIIILDSILILALVVLIAIQPHKAGLLLLAGVAAGLNASLQAFTLEELPRAVRGTLLGGGLATIAVMVGVSVL